jgi:hypothetical protein
VVTLPGGRRPPAWRVAVTRADTSERASRIDVALPGAPWLWYVMHREPAAAPPATTLLAFSDARWPEGTVLSGDEALAGGVSGEQQVAAFRWWSDSA